MNTLQEKDASYIVGNGRMSAVVSDSTEHAEFHITEESVWDSSFKDRNNKDCADSLKKIHNLLSESKDSQAKSLLQEVAGGSPSQCASLHEACSLKFDFYSSAERKGFETVSECKEMLDMETAVASVSFSYESSAPSTAIFSRNTDGSSIMFSREVFASAPADVIAFHITASIPKCIYFRMKLDCPTAHRQYSLGDDVVAAESICGIPFCAMAMAVASGGKTFVRGGWLLVEGADDVTVYIDVETAFRSRHYARKGGNTVSLPSRIAGRGADVALKKLCIASSQPYQDFRAEHIFEFSHKYNKTQLLLSKPDSEKQLEWNYAKYLFLSLNRKPGTLPALLGRKYLVRDFPVETFAPMCLCGMKQFFVTVANLLERAYKHGKKTAMVMYHCSGYVIHNSLDIWGDGVLSDDTQKNDNSFNIMGAAHLALYIREYYEYTLEKKFLKKHFRLLKDACEFYADFLEKYPDSPFVDKWLVSRLFNVTLHSVKDLCMDDTKSDIIRLKKLSEELENSKPVAEKESLLDGDGIILENARILTSMVQNIVSSELVDDTVGKCVVIRLLNDVQKIGQDGSFIGVCIKGNLKMNIAWKGSDIISAKLYTQSGSDFIKAVCLQYKGREYKADIEGETLDVKNILPSTV